MYRSGKNPEKRLEVAVGELLNLGGLYVKFAQLLLLNKALAKAVPPSLKRAVFDRVYVDARLTYRAFLSGEDLAMLSQKVATISEYPQYAGSFAVVFDGRLHDGRAVVIKVLRPELRHDLQRDLRLIGMITRAIGVFKGETKIAIQNAYNSFRANTTKETNYLHEVANAERIEESFKDDPYIRIPHTFADISSNTMLVQEKLDGVWLSELLQKELKGEAAITEVQKRTGSDLQVQLHNLGWRSMYATLSNKVVHGDPHPGNIVLLPNNQVGLIDFGLLAEPVKNRLAMLDYTKLQIKAKEGDGDVARLMLGIVRFHASYLYRAIDSIATYYRRPLFEDIYQYLSAEAREKHMTLNQTAVDEGRHSEMLSAGINRDNRFALVPRFDNPVNQKAFVTLWRVYDELGFAHSVLDVFREAVAAVERDFPTHEWKEATMPIDKAFEVVSEWLGMVAERDPKLFANLRNIFKLS